MCEVSVEFPTGGHFEQSRLSISPTLLLHPKADVERLYIPRKDGGRGLIRVETAFKMAKIMLDHYLKNKDEQYTKQVLEHDRSKVKNSITKNASKFKREVPMSEFEKKEDKSASENAKAPKNMIKSKMKPMKEEKWKNKALHGQDPREASCWHSHHQ